MERSREPDRGGQRGGGHGPAGDRQKTIKNYKKRLKTSNTSQTKIIKTIAPSLTPHPAIDCPPAPPVVLGGPFDISSAHAQVSTWTSAERSREPDRRGQRGGPRTCRRSSKNCRKLFKQNYPKRRTNLNKKHQNNCPLSDPSPRNRLPSCPTCGTRGPVGHVIGPCPGPNKALHGAEQGARQKESERGGPQTRGRSPQQKLPKTSNRSKQKSTKQLPPL